MLFATWFEAPRKMEANYMKREFIYTDARNEKKKWKK